jgi:plastocyanin
MTDAAEAASGEASPLLSKGDMTSFVFNEAGEFNVYCEPHPVMKMKVIVEEGASTSGEVALELADYAFSEESITVAPGTVITWTNQDSAQHNVAFE